MGRNWKQQATPKSKKYSNNVIIGGEKFICDRGQGNVTS